MKKTHLIIALTLFVSFYSFSQDRNTSLRNGVFNNNLEFFALQKIETKYNNQYITNAKGRYKLFNDWKKCTITTKDDRTLSSPCNYNLFSDEFEIKIENDIYFVEASQVKEILIEDNKYLPLNTNLPKSKEDYKSYYNLIAKGNKLELVERYKLKLKTVASSTSLGLYENKFQIKEGLFFKLDNGELVEVPKSTKKIMQTLHLNKSLSNKYKKTNLKKLENLIPLVKEL